MNSEINFGHLDQPHSSVRQPSHRNAFHIALLGDFTGRGNRGLCEVGDALARRRPILVDRDNQSLLMRKLNVRLEKLLVTDDEEDVSLEFHDLDDFHPDQLFEKVGIFGSLRASRRRLLNPETSAQAAEEIAGWVGSANQANRTPQDKKAPTAAAEDAKAFDTGELLDQIVGGYKQRGERGAEQCEIDWRGLLRDIVAPYAVPALDRRYEPLVKAVDASVTATMLALLHHPAVRQLEAAWRSVDLLVRYLETGPQLKLFLIDISAEELRADLMASDSLADSGLYRLLVESTVETPGGQPWSLLLGNYTFGRSAEDLSVLGRMARISKAAGAPFTAGADGHLVGCAHPDRTPDHRDWHATDVEGWDALRHLVEAEAVALWWPRFLLRYPYGEAGSPTERFAFEEVTPATRQYLLWGNPAFLVAGAIGKAFVEQGWQLRIDAGYEVADLPVWVYEEDGESVAHPCTELLLSDAAVRRVMSCGIMPLVAVQHRDVVRIPPIQSVRGTRLSGPWGP